MQVSNINTTNTSFSGLYSSRKNNENKHVIFEYAPYSWENNNTSTKAKAELVDIYANKLPDNDRTNFKAKNIPAMNREESLIILNNKYTTFIEEKQNIQKKLSSEIDRLNENTQNTSNFYDKWSETFHKNYFLRDKTKSEIKTEMDIQKEFLKNNAQNLYETTKKYMQITNSIIEVMSEKERNITEINKLKELRQNNLLIDISKQDVSNPNQALKIALENIKTASEKFLCMPDKTISIKEIIKKISSNHSTDVTASQILEQVEKMIKKTI